jgi:hypothetical protein
MAISYAANVKSPTNLWQMVQDYTSNTEATFVSYIPTFVQVAEERVYNTIQIPVLRKNATGAVTANNYYLALPSDWLATFSLSVIDPITQAQTFLLNKDVEYIRAAFPFPAATGTPTHYAQFDVSNLIIGPTPDQSYAVELHYYYYPVSIVSAGTTWLSTNFENVLLYGTLREAYLFMKGEADMVKYYEEKYMEGMAMLKVLAEGKDRRDSYRSGQNRISIP